MSKVKALISFSGLISMTQGETKDVEDRDILDDLLQAKFIEVIEETAKIADAEAIIPADVTPVTETVETATEVIEETPVAEEVKPKGKVKSNENIGTDTTNN